MRPFNEYGVLFGLGAGAEPTATAKGTAAYVLLAGSDGRPAFGQLNLAGAGVTGDLAYANLAQGSALSVLGVAGNATADVASIAAGSDSTVLRRNGTTLEWSKIDTANINGAAVTYAKIQNVSAASKLLGRGSASGSGDVEEITLGTGLSMSGTTLNGPTVAYLIPFTSVSIQLSDSATRYVGYWLSATETDVSMPALSSGTLRRLFVRVSADPANGVLTQSYAFTVRKNEADTTLTCTISEGAVQASDTSNTVAVTAGDRLAIKAVPSNTPTLASVWAGVELVL